MHSYGLLLPIVLALGHLGRNITLCIDVIIDENFLKNLGKPCKTYIHTMYILHMEDCRSPETVYMYVILCMDKLCVPTHIPGVKGKWRRSSHWPIVLQVLIG
jgi:hypothetical protein